MNPAANPLPELATLLAQRLALVGTLAISLEESRLALVRNDAEAIARGAAHQAELCRQWGNLEKQLRAQAARLPSPAAAPSDTQRSAELEAEWQALRRRIAYLTRVHCSLLRHMQRSLGILQRVVESCAATYVPAPSGADSRAPAPSGD
jgi:hypothetical protein